MGAHGPTFIATLRFSPPAVETGVSDRWTIRRVLEWSAKDLAQRGADSPRLDAELLIAEALGIDRVGLYLDLDRPLATSELDRVRPLLERRRAREPVAYILGRREFWGRRFDVSPAVLVPRPDTETLVERALELLPREADVQALDLGTGSGILAVTLAAERPRARIDAVDLSGEALSVARANAERHGVADRVSFHLGDLFAPLPEGRRFDLIVSNPPYIPEREVAELPPEISRFEPKLALAAGDDGLDVLRRIAADAFSWLAPGGIILVEIGMGQADAVQALFAAAGLVALRSHADLAGIARVVEACRPAEKERPGSESDPRVG